MKTKIAAFFTLCASLSMSGCLPFQVIEGDGNLVTENIDITDYETIEISGEKININYEQTEDSPLFTVTTDQNIFEKYNFSVDGSTLKIKPKKEFKRANFRPTEFTVKTSSKKLNKIDAAGSTKLDVNSRLTTENLDIDVSGSGEVNLKDSTFLDRLTINLAGSGTLNAFHLAGKNFHGDIAGSGKINLGGTLAEAYFNVAGSGTVRAFDLTVDKLNSSIAGSGDIEITVNESISTQVAGSGHIKYKGNPGSISKNIMGSGSVKKVD